MAMPATFTNRQGAAREPPSPLSADIDKSPPTKPLPHDRQPSHYLIVNSSTYHLSFRAQPRNLRCPASHRPHTLASTFTNKPGAVREPPFPPSTSTRQRQLSHHLIVISSIYHLSFRAQPRNLRRPASHRPHTLAATFTNRPGALREAPAQRLLTNGRDEL